MALQIFIKIHQITSDTFLPQIPSDSSSQQALLNKKAASHSFNIGERVLELILVVTAPFRQILQAHIRHFTPLKLERFI